MEQRKLGKMWALILWIIFFWPGAIWYWFSHLWPSPIIPKDEFDDLAKKHKENDTKGGSK